MKDKKFYGKLKGVITFEKLMRIEIIGLTGIVIFASSLAIGIVYHTLTKNDLLLNRFKRSRGIYYASDDIDETKRARFILLEGPPKNEIPCHIRKLLKEMGPKKGEPD